MRVSSDALAQERSLTTITHLFSVNGYPSHLIHKAIKNNKHRRNVKHRKSKSTTSNAVYMRLPYVDETIAQRVNGILRGAKIPIKPVWVNNNSLGKKLISSALVKPPCPSGAKKCHTCSNGLQGRCNTKNIVYKVTCLGCQTEQRNESYIGESTRPVRYRFNEHLSDARLRKLDTPLGEHTLQHHANLSNSDIKSLFHIEILDHGRDCAEVKIKESIHIRNQKPSLNSMHSSWPLTR